MGNCIKGLGVVEEMVKVVTPNGGLMELYSPISAESITDEFPGYSLFPSPRRVSPPLLHNEHLCSGQYYYLLPLQYTRKATSDINTVSYRMSADMNQGMLKRLSESEILPRCSNAGVWKVRLVINTDQLSEILSQESRTEALIESVRTVAKCASGAPSAGNSDHRSWTEYHQYGVSLN
ncbi:hypothetical protein ACS0TY_002308 [Phlomoides rotata]